MSLSDFRYSARALLRNPAFSSLAIMTIALGVGANTSIFTAVEGVLLKSFSFPEAERLVVVNGVSKSLPNMAHVCCGRACDDHCARAPLVRRSHTQSAVDTYDSNRWLYGFIHLEHARTRCSSIADPF